MRWLYATVGLLTASLCLLAWVYLRDRDPSTLPQPERQLARVDAATALATLGGADCRSGCAAAPLRRIQPHRWLVRVTVQGQPQCLQIDLDTFAVTRRHGLSGVRPSRCPLRG
jgi:hypothetical protein